MQLQLYCTESYRDLCKKKLQIKPLVIVFPRCPTTNAWGSSHLIQVVRVRIGIEVRIR